MKTARKIQTHQGHSPISGAAVARYRHSDEPGIAGRDAGRGQGVSHGGPNLHGCGGVAHDGYITMENHHFLWLNQLFIPYNHFQ